jgi:hypothetical protein
MFEAYSSGRPNTLTETDVESPPWHVQPLSPNPPTPVGMLEKVGAPRTRSNNAVPKITERCLCPPMCIIQTHAARPFDPWAARCTCSLIIYR